MVILSYYRCIVPACDTNLTDLQYNRTFLEFTIPYNKTSGFSKCQRYKHIDEEEGCIPSAFMENTTEDCPEGKVFDTTVYATTIVTEVSHYWTSVSLVGLLFRCMHFFVSSSFFLRNLDSFVVCYYILILYGIYRR